MSASEDQSSEFQPDEAKMRRGLAALFPFVEAWELPLNPEKLDLMVYVVLKHTVESDASPAALERIQEEVEAVLAEEAENHARMLEEIRRSTEM